MLGIFCLLSLATDAQTIERLEEEVRMEGLPVPKRIVALNLLSRDLSFVDPVRAALLAKNALELSLKTHNQTQIAYAYRNLSNVYTLNENYFLSMEYLQRALAIFSGTHDSVGIANCYISLGHIYRGLQDQKEEIHYHKMAFEIFSRLNIAERIAVTAHNLGESYYNNGDLSKSETLTKQAILLNDSLNNRSVLSSCYKVMGLIAFSRKDYLTAESYFNEVLDISQLLGEKSQKVATVESLIRLAEISRFNGNIKKQVGYLKKAAQLSEKYNLANRLPQVYNTLISHFSTEGDHVAAQKYMKEFIHASDKVRREQLKDRAELIKSVVLVHTLEDKNRLLVQNNKIQLERVEKRTTLLIAASFFTVIAIYMVMKLFQANRKIKSANLMLNEQNETIKKQKAELQLANETKDKFFSIVAHDLKSPLVTLKSFSVLLVQYFESLTKDDILEMGHNLQQQIDSTIKMTDDLITWARLQRKNTEPDLQRFRVAELARDISSVYSEIAASKNISLVSEVDQETAIFADKNQITFVVRNLINNAIKFTRPGGWVKLRTEAVSTSSINIIISDNGLGISESMLKNIFKVGKIRSSTGTAGEKGAGLGLILIHEFTKLNNGTIAVESKEGHGTEFKVQLNLAS